MLVAEIVTEYSIFLSFWANPRGLVQKKSGMYKLFHNYEVSFACAMFSLGEA
jgi:hypothetical protein